MWLLLIPPVYRGEWEVHTFSSEEGAEYYVHHSPSLPELEDDFFIIQAETLGEILQEAARQQQEEEKE